MKDENLIKETKETNGNRSISQKDLLFYVVGRVDKLDTKLDETIRLLNSKVESKLDKKTFSTFLITSISILLALIGGAFKLFTSLLKGG